MLTFFSLTEPKLLFFTANKKNLLNLVE